MNFAKKTHVSKNNRTTIPDVVRAFSGISADDDIVWTNKGNDLCVVKFHPTAKKEGKE